MKRIFIVAVGILTVGTLIGGNMYWNQKVDATTQKAKQSLHKEQSHSSSKSSTTSNISVSKTSSNSVEPTSNNQMSNSIETSSTKTNTTTSGEIEDHETTQATTASSTNENKKKTVADIKKEYTELFNELEAQQTSKVDQLVVQAKADYVSAKGTKTEVISKYQAVAQQLEAQADQSFNVIYRQLQYDLEKNGHSLNEAQEFQQTYNSKKASRAKRISSEIAGF